MKDRNLKKNWKACFRFIGCGHPLGNITAPFSSDGSKQIQEPLVKSNKYKQFMSPQ
jgi:hypothetical protein